MALPPGQMIAEWRRNPAKMVHDLFKVEKIDAWQLEALQAFASTDPSHRRIAMRAAAGVGKSTCLAWMTWNFLLCYADKDNFPKAAAVSTGRDALRDNFWSELNHWKSKSELLQACFHTTGEKIFAKEHPQNWFISARSFPKTANPDEIGRTLSGLHAKYILYVIDESGDISPNIVKSAEQGLSTGPKFGKIVQVGNPTSLEGMLYAASTTLADQWFNIQVTGDPLDPRRSSRIDPVWAQQQLDTYGRDNAWCQAFILGQFPKSSINTLVSVEEVEEAMRRDYHPSVYQDSQKRLGCDIARFGLDDTVIFPRQGLQAFESVVMQGARTNEIAARIAIAKSNWGSEMEVIDGTGGFGSGVVDSLIQAGLSPYEVNFSGKSPESQYLNLRAFMWFKMASWLKRGGAIPNDAKLKKELTAVTYTFNNGKLQLESKDQIKARLGFSLDKSDALAMTFAFPDQPTQSLMPDILKNKLVKKWHNPFDRE